MPARIAVVGDVMLDIEFHGTPRFDAPETGHCFVSGAEGMRYLPGGAANVAWLLLQQGCEVQLFGAIGEDWAGQALERMFTPQVSRLVPYAACTTIKLRVYTDNQLRLRLDREERELLRPLNPWVGEGYDAYVLSDYGKGVFSGEARVWVTELLKHAQIPVIVDPNVLARNGLWDGATIATPNRKEEAAVSGTIWKAVTMDGQGAKLYGPNGYERHFPTAYVEDPKIVGAGDAFVAQMAHSLAAGWDVPEATKQAVAFATHYVEVGRQ